MLPTGTGGGVLAAVIPLPSSLPARAAAPNAGRRLSGARARPGRPGHVRPGMTIGAGAGQRGGAQCFPGQGPDATVDHLLGDSAAFSGRLS
jgi:hypothetical protein